MIVSLPRKSAAGSRGSPPDNDLRTKVLADPDDAALRSVWADALIEGGDPLGELIAIQDRARDAPLTAAQDKRMRSLIAKHRVAWLGPLSGVCQHREGLLFDRGLLSKPSRSVRSRSSSSPRWAPQSAIRDGPPSAGSGSAIATPGTRGSSRCSSIR
jgi:uncharacterized protein (TIGR02996 family)